MALSVLDSFFQRARQGAFPDLNDREDLWRLLVFKTVRKAIDKLRWERSQKRGGGRVPATDAELQRVIGREPSPELAAEFADSCQHLLAQLPDDLRQIAVWRMEGYSVEEIAGRIGRCDRTVKRYLDLIRTQWDGEDEP